MKNEPIKILYLEHEPNHVERLKVELDKGQYEYKLTHADSGSSFETEIDKAIPDVVLFDHDIPDYDISMAMETLKDHDIDAPFILVTSTLEGEKAVDMIVNYGVSDYILKDNLSRLNPAILREYKNRQIHNQLNEHKKDLEKLSLVASHTNNGVIITDKQGQIEWVNQAFTTITGYTLEESLGKIPGHFLQGEDTSEEKVTQIREKLKEEVSFSEVILNYHKTGYPYWIKLDISPVKDEDGNLNKFIAIQEDVTDRKNAEFEIIRAKEKAEKSESDLKKALSEKEILIQEIHHRVKNNLAIISGLLQLQILRGADNSQLLDAKNRIHTIASVHEQLYNTDNFSEIDVNKYFSSLILKSKNTFLGPDQEIDINFNSSIDILNINEAVPLGLLVNELITNSVKHAFPNNKGSITMTMNSAPNGMIEFSYSDSGKGFDRAKFEKHEGFGLELINTLISQLTEDFTLKTDGEFSLTFQFNRKLRGAHSNL
jgi:PAS domain S-box-containing protein